MVLPDLFSLGYVDGESAKLITSKKMEDMGEDLSGGWQEYHHTALEMTRKLEGDIFCLAVKESPGNVISYMGNVNFKFADLRDSLAGSSGIAAYEAMVDYGNLYGFNETPMIGSSLHQNLLVPRPDESNTICFLGAALRKPYEGVGLPAARPAGSKGADTVAYTEDRNQGHWGHTYPGCKAARWYRLSLSLSVSLSLPLSLTKKN